MPQKLNADVHAGAALLNPFVLLIVTISFASGACSAQRASSYTDHRDAISTQVRLLPMVVLKGHTDTVRTATFNSESSRIVTASLDGTARLWNTRGDQLAVLPASEVRRAVFSPDDSRIITLSWSKTEHLWNSEGEPLAALTGHPEMIYYAEFSPDSSHIVTASADGSARLWDRDGKPIAALHGHSDLLLFAKFSPDGQRIVTASDDGTARVWDVEGNDVAVLDDHSAGVFYAGFDPSGDRIITDSFDKTVRLWDREGKAIATLPGNIRWGRGMRFNPDGDRFVTPTHDGTARLYDRDGNEVAVLADHTGEVWEARFSPDGSRIVTASKDKSARLWDRNGKPLAVLTGHTDIPLVTFSPDSTMLLTTVDNVTARLWDRDGNPLAVIEGQNAEFSPNSRYIVACSDDNTAIIYQVPSMQRREPTIGTVVTQIDPRIWQIHQDRSGDYWFGSNGAGIFRYDGERLIQYTQADGLGGDQVRDIQEDRDGNIYISASDTVTKFDGTSLTAIELAGAPADGTAWVLDPDDVWIVVDPGRRGPCRYDGERLYEMQLTPSPVEDELSSTPGTRFTGTGVYSIYKDRRGHLWFGTAGVGVCRFDGAQLSWLYEERLNTTPSGGAFGIRCVYQDRAGDYWICNTRQRFDVTTDITTEDGHQLITYTKKPGLPESQTDDASNFDYFPSMTEDNDGALWMACGNAGVWKYDHSDGEDAVTKYTIGNDAYVITIHCDRAGTLWVGTLNQGIFTFDATGDAFVSFKP